MEKYHELHSQSSSMRTQYEAKIDSLRRRLDEVMEEPETASESGQSEQPTSLEGAQSDNVSLERSRGEKFISIGLVYPNIHNFV